MALTSGDILVYDGSQWNNQPSVPGPFSIDSPTFYVDPTNNRVGIGTTTPDQIVDIEAAGANVRIRGNTGSGTRGYLTQGGTATYLTHNAYFTGTSTNFDPDNDTVGASSIQLDRGLISLRVAAATLGTPISWTIAMRINSSGNVGIGTTDPDFLLHVAGRLAYGVPNSAPSDGGLSTSQLSAYLDETNNKLKFRVRYSSGGGSGYKTGSVDLT